MDSSDPSSSSDPPPNSDSSPLLPHQDIASTILQSTTTSLIPSVGTSQGTQAAGGRAARDNTPPGACIELQPVHAATPERRGVAQGATSSAGGASILEQQLLGCPMLLDPVTVNEVVNIVPACIDEIAYTERPREKVRSLREGARKILHHEAETFISALWAGFQSIFNHPHTYLMIVFGCLAVMICQKTNFIFPVEWSILSVGAVFPLSFAISQSYSRREQANAFITNLRTACMGTMLLYYDLNGPENAPKDPEESDRRRRAQDSALKLLTEICNTVRLFLLHEETPLTADVRAYVTHAWRAARTLGMLHLRFLKGSPVYARAHQLVSDIVKATDDLVRVRQSKPPRGLRAACTLLVYSAPIILAPSFARSQCDPRFVATHGATFCPGPYLGIFILVVVLMTLHRVEINLDNPFSMVNLDDLKFDAGWDLQVFDQMRPFDIDPSGDVRLEVDYLTDDLPPVNVNRGNPILDMDEAKEAFAKAARMFGMLALAMSPGGGGGLLLRETQSSRFAAAAASSGPHQGNPTPRGSVHGTVSGHTHTAGSAGRSDREYSHGGPGAAAGSTGMTGGTGGSGSPGLEQRVHHVRRPSFVLPSPGGYNNGQTSSDTLGGGTGGVGSGSGSGPGFREASVGGPGGPRDRERGSGTVPRSASPIPQAQRLRGPL